MISINVHLIDNNKVVIVTSHKLCGFFCNNIVLNVKLRIFCNLKLLTTVKCRLNKIKKKKNSIKSVNYIAIADYN